jgi:3'(2'), 5'-bisphosphate nucleotidase
MKFLRYCASTGGSPERFRVATPMEDVMIESALAGGDAIMAIYSGPIEARIKDDASPVTAADEAAEEAILAVLSQRAPDLPIISEEMASRGIVPEAERRFFLVDPLDGTKEFISRNGEFTVNVALIEDGEPIAGVVYAPAIARLFVGRVGGGAREATLDDGTVVGWREIAARRPPSDGLAVVASRSHRDAETDRLLERLPVRDLVSAGSSLKFCLVAAGEADFYPRLGRTMEWDTAAGHAVLSAAGGKVMCVDGGPLRYGHEKPDRLANPHFLAFGSWPQEDVAALVRARR